MDWRKQLSEHLQRLDPCTYDGSGHTVQVWRYHPSQGWVQPGANIPATFVNGDQFGARARAHGTAEIYKKGVLIATRSITSWPSYSNG
jgi:hypothetical protein